MDNDGLKIKCEADQGVSATHIDAMADHVTGDKYYYTGKSLLGCSRSLRGDVTLCFTKAKLLAIYCGDVRYMQIGRKPAAQKKDAKKGKAAA